MFRPLLAVALLSIPQLGFGHEAWIDPERHMVAPGDRIVAAARVGEGYEGASYAFLPPQFLRFDYALGDVVAEVPSRIGDRPAVSMPAPGEGLVALILVSKDSSLVWDEWEKFASFVTHKDADFALDRHRERGLPDEGFKELYSRHAKSLVAVGDGAGSDRAFGLETELVALENPYTGDMEDGLDVELLYRGEPRGEAQIEVFEKDAAGDVVISTVTTDAAGRATIPVRPGRRYMLDAVVLREPAADKAETSGAVWESLWANLTFAVP